MHAAPTFLHKTPHFKLRLNFAGAYEAPKGKNFPFHQHTEWELVYYRSGNIEFLLGDEIVPIEPGTLLFAPPRVPHSERALTAYANFHLQVSAPASTRWPRLCYDDASQTLNRICAQLVDEFRGAAFARDEMIKLLTEQLAIALERAVRDTGVSRAGADGAPGGDSHWQGFHRAAADQRSGEYGRRISLIVAQSIRVIARLLAARASAKGASAIYAGLVDDFRPDAGTHRRAERISFRQSSVAVHQGEVWQESGFPATSRPWTERLKTGRRSAWCSGAR
jgi:hypothetical protein